jgi:hypothetical protein
MYNWFRDAQRKGGIMMHKPVRLRVCIFSKITLPQGYTQTAEVTYWIRLVSFSLVE